VVKVFLEKYILAPSSNSFPAFMENLRSNAAFTKPLHSVLFNSVPNFTNCLSSINFNILSRYMSKSHAFASFDFYRTKFHSPYLFLECILHTALLDITIVTLDEVEKLSSSLRSFHHPVTSHSAQRPSIYQQHFTIQLASRRFIIRIRQSLPPPPPQWHNSPW
jgi:hypothetical protein